MAFFYHHGAITSRCPLDPARYFRPAGRLYGAGAEYLTSLPWKDHGALIWIMLKFRVFEFFLFLFEIFIYRTSTTVNSRSGGRKVYMVTFL